MEPEPQVDHPTGPSDQDPPLVTPPAAKYIDEHLIWVPQDIVGDGTVMKTIVVSGCGKEKPGKGSQVAIHYVARSVEDGEELANTRGEGDAAAFEFKVGEGEVLPWMDQVVATMREGERAQVVLAVEVDSGIEGLPPDTRISFEVELLAWQEFKDISAEKDGSIRVMNYKGQGWENPDFSAILTVSWKLTLLYSSEVLEEKEEFTFEFLVDEIPVGLERALGHMTEKERAVVQLAPRQAFGAEGNPRLNVPPDSDVVYDVTLKSIQNPPPKWKLSFQERRSLALKLKEEGNGHFKQGLSERLVRAAVWKYKLALGYLKEESAADTAVEGLALQMPEGDAAGLDEEVRSATRALQTTLHLNIAAAAIKTQSWAAAAAEAGAALELEPGSTKARLRRGKALLELGREEEAQQELQRVLEVDGAPEIPEAKRVLACAQKKLREHAAQDREKLKGLFGAGPGTAVETTDNGTAGAGAAAGAGPGTTVETTDHGAAGAGAAAESQEVQPQEEQEGLKGPAAQPDPAPGPATEPAATGPALDTPTTPSPATAIQKGPTAQPDPAPGPATEPAAAGPALDTPHTQPSPATAKRKGHRLSDCPEAAAAMGPNATKEQAFAFMQQLEQEKKRLEEEVRRLKDRDAFYESQQPKIVELPDEDEA